MKNETKLGHLQKDALRFLRLSYGWQTVRISDYETRRVMRSLVERKLIEQHDEYLDMFRAC